MRSIKRGARALGVSLLLINVFVSQGYAGTESLTGRLVSEDGKKGVIELLLPGDGKRAGDKVIIFVGTFLKSKGAGALDRLDVGNDIAVTVESGAGGQRELVSINKLERSQKKTPTAKRSSKARFQKIEGTGKSLDRTSSTDVYKFL